MKIITKHEYPPIPIRSFDWSAIDDDTYDGLGSPIGHGATEAEAIEDLKSQLEDAECEHDELDHGICLDCGKDCFDDEIAAAEFRADCMEDR